MEVFDTIGKVLSYVNKNKSDRILVVVDKDHSKYFDRYQTQDKYQTCFNTGNNTELNRFATATVVVTSVQCLDRNLGLDLSFFHHIIGYKIPERNFTAVMSRYKNQREERRKQGFHGFGGFVSELATDFVKDKVTPLKLEVILHYYYQPEELREEMQSGPTEEAINFWLRNGMIELTKLASEHSPDDYDETDDTTLYYNRYQTTEKGRVYIEGLCSLPFPIPTWSMPHMERLR